MMQQLAIHSDDVKKLELKQQLMQCAKALNHLTQFQALFQHWQHAWQENAKLLKQGFAWSLTIHANRYARSNTDVMVKQQPLFVWDEWAQNRLDDVLNELIATTAQLQIPAMPLRTRLVDLRQTVAKSVHQSCELECRLALMQPGNALHRGLLKAAAICEVLLPLIALSVVAYQVFYGYYQSAISTKAYLGVDFVAHSSLLVLISWLLPYFVVKKMQPSLEKTALRGLHRGLDKALAAIELEVKQAITAHQQQQQQILAQLHGYIAECEVNSEAEKASKNNLLDRILLD
jgi:hypothetical protein